MLSRLILTAMLSAATLPTSAHAALYEFDLTGSRVANFRLESTAPDFSSPFQSQFQNVVGSFGGSQGTASAISFGAVFFISALDVSGTPLGFTQFAGPPLFTGPTSSPVFTPGTYQLSGIVSGQSDLTIAAVPEPTSWAMMALGFGLVGGVLRRRIASTTASPVLR